MLHLLPADGQDDLASEAATPSPALPVTVGTTTWPQCRERTQLEPLYLSGGGDRGWEN